MGLGKAGAGDRAGERAALGRARAGAGRGPSGVSAAGLTRAQRCGGPPPPPPGQSAAPPPPEVLGRDPELPPPWRGGKGGEEGVTAAGIKGPKRNLNSSLRRYVTRWKGNRLSPLLPNPLLCFPTPPTLNLPPQGMGLPAAGQVST